MYLIDHVAELRFVNRSIYSIKRIHTHVGFIIRSPYLCLISVHTKLMHPIDIVSQDSTLDVPVGLVIICTPSYTFYLLGASIAIPDPIKPVIRIAFSAKFINSSYYRSIYAFPLNLSFLHSPYSQ